MTGAWLLADNKNKYLIAQVVAKVMQFDTASQNKLKCYIREGGHYGQRNKQYIRIESLYGD